MKIYLRMDTYWQKLNGQRKKVSHSKRRRRRRKIHTDTNEIKSGKKAIYIYECKKDKHQNDAYDPIEQANKHM